MNNKCPFYSAAYNIDPEHVGRTFACQYCQSALIVSANGLRIAGTQTPAQGDLFVDYLTFRRMIVPYIIIIVFWVGALVCIALGFVGSITADDAGTRRFMLGLMIAAPILLRIWCEVILVVFRINETLTDILNELKTKR